MRDVCARFEVPNDEDQAVEEAQASPGGIGGLTEVGEVQATEGEQGMDVDAAEEMGTGGIIAEVVVRGVESPKEVNEEGEEEVSGERKRDKRRKKESAAKKQPAPSSPDRSTRSTTHKQNDSPARNTRSSKRITKPSRRRRGSDYA